MPRQIAKAAGVLGYSAADWYTLTPAERSRSRNEVRNAQRRVHTFAKRDAEHRKGDYWPGEEWDSTDWDLYREEMGL